jgi:hypothetical protein
VVAGVVEAGAERAAVAEERAQAARVDLEVEAPGAELAVPAGPEVDLAAAGEVAEAPEAAPEAEAPALVAAWVDPVVDLAAEAQVVRVAAVRVAAVQLAEAQVVRVAAVQLAVEVRQPSLANG